MDDQSEDSIFFHVQCTDCNFHFFWNSLNFSIFYQIRPLYASGVCDLYTICDKNLKEQLKTGAACFCAIRTLLVEQQNLRPLMYATQCTDRIFNFRGAQLIFGTIFVNPINICATLKKALSKSKLQSVHYTRQNIDFIFQSCMYSGWIWPKTLRIT